MARGRLGELLLARTLISERELSAALSLQAEVGGLLGLVLVRIGAVSEERLLEVVGEQLDLEVLGPRELPPLDRIEALIGESAAPLSWWLDRQAVAWRTEDAAGAGVVCAAVQPLDPALRERLAKAFGPDVEFRIAPRAVIAAALEELTRGAQAGSAAAREADAVQLRELAQEAPVVDFVNGLFSEALERRASDVHVEPFEERFVVRMRVDGILATARTGPRSSFDAVCSRIKLLSGMDIGERRLPQDGRQSIRIAGQELDLRVSTLPTAWGESVVLRLLGKSTRLPELKELGLGEDQARQLLGLVDRPDGVVLVSGPTGSGKTTTIYRLLTHLNDGARKIVTVEDPVEFDLPGVVQVRARPEIGLSFAAGLRSILRQDPDVIMVGEIRDPETARIAVQAAMTGHMVISTVHTNSALAAAARLVDLGVEDYLLADVLGGLVGQRLVRRLCPHCARPASADEIEVLERTAPPFNPAAGPASWRAAVGCPRCAGLGYAGRLGLYEIARSTPALQHDIRRRAGEEELARTARQDGFLTIFEDGWAKARAGLTTMAEVLRVANAPGEGSASAGERPLAVGQ